MKPITAEWVAKAEGDWTTAQREVVAQQAPNYDAGCFHAQQCAEKYLKAVLLEAAIKFPKTHDLPALVELLAPASPVWEQFEPELRSLTAMAVEVRYPGADATRTDALRALNAAGRVREAARTALGFFDRSSADMPPQCTE
jgi:HEPN domain-containing protein